MIDQFLSMVWGISAGILTLLGIVGVFLSLSSQQKLEKSREIYWELMSPPIHTFKRKAYNQEGLSDYVDFLRSRYSLYQYLEEQMNSSLNKRMLKFTSRTILAVVLIWGIGVLGLTFKISDYLEIIYLVPIFLIFIGCSLLLTSFEELIYKVKNLFQEENLPTIKELLNASSNESRVNTLKFLVDTVAYHVRFDSYDEKLEVLFEHSLPFHNFLLKTEIMFFDDTETLIHTEKNSQSFIYNPEKKVEKGLKHRIEIPLKTEIIAQVKHIKIDVHYGDKLNKNSELISFADIFDTWHIPKAFTVYHLSEREIAEWLGEE